MNETPIFGVHGVRYQVTDVAHDFHGDKVNASGLERLLLAAVAFNAVKGKGASAHQPAPAVHEPGSGPQQRRSRPRGA
jgi:hypothetical protein